MSVEVEATGPRKKKQGISGKQQISVWISTVVVTLAFPQVKNFNTNGDDPATTREGWGLITKDPEHQVETGFNRLQSCGYREVMDDGDAVGIRKVFTRTSTWASHLLCSNPHATCFYMYDHNLCFQ